MILILADRQIDGIGFTALQKELNRSQTRTKSVQVGTIYHHIGLLGDLIAQNEKSKSWTLSDRGWFAFNLLTTSQDRDEFLSRGDLERASFVSLLFRIIAPPRLFFLIKKSLILFIGWQILFFLLFSFITAQAELVLVFVFFSAIAIICLRFNLILFHVIIFRVFTIITNLFFRVIMY